MNPCRTKQYLHRHESTHMDILYNKTNNLDVQNAPHTLRRRSLSWVRPFAYGAAFLRPCPVICGYGCRILRPYPLVCGNGWPQLCGRILWSVAMDGRTFTTVSYGLLLRVAALLRPYAVVCRIFSTVSNSVCQWMAAFSQL